MIYQCRRAWLSMSFLLALCVLVLSSCGPSSNIQSTRTESLYDKIIKAGKIRCAYVVFFPSCIKDPNTGKLSGIGVDALEMISKKLGLTVEWTEEVGWGNMIEGLQSGRYDMIASPIWTNAPRARQAAFSKPLFFSPVFVYVKRGDRRFSGHLERIDSPNIKIATIDGETAQVIADADFPRASRLSMPQMTDCSQMLLNVASGKADVTILEPAFTNQFIRHNPISIENICPERPIRVFPNCWMFKRGEFEFKAMLDTVLDEVINSGAMDKIISRYEKASGEEVYRVALPYKSVSSKPSV